jgi:uncharacterized protein (TIGR03435 family)
MRTHAQRRRLIIATAGFVAVIVAGALTASRLGAQAPATLPAVPQWQIDAGGKMAFDVASVKPDKSDANPIANFPLTFVDDHPSTGGRLSVVNFRLITYIAFAYKLAPGQQQLVRPQLPKWATTESFDIEAKAEGNPTKDQMRLMMQSLLADRFKLAVHFETRQLPVYALVLEKPGQTGPQLKPHIDDPPCGAFTSPQAGDDGWIMLCGALGGTYVSGRLRNGSRNLTMEQIAGFLPAMANLDRPVQDRTGLGGSFDLRIEFTPEFNGPPPPNFQPDPSGPTFLEALHEQLGLKLEPQTGPVDVLVIDHVEEPSPN